MSSIARLHHITQDLPSLTHSELAEVACMGGAKWIQFREKTSDAMALKSHAIETLAVCRKYGAKLIVNDNVYLAKEILADGVHLGKTDMAPLEARKILGPEAIIGGTANTFEDIQKLAEAKVDYIGLGPFRFTSTKSNLSPLLGMDGYKEIIKLCKEAGILIPIIAIGGIKPEDVEALLEAGIHGIAVSSYINQADDRVQATSEMLSVIEKTINKTVSR
jgi:thiamine-phosphate pyrophosphorylase